ncbi:hypothetical protein [Rhodoferax fermentans]|uniref:Uncharacterized protein n=1 Tax=Rhodoferax fermentans TaxID=28066 RepID=A0A1T1ANS3_RHOFE|nr:hypothetical protein [Rhodoferax fermentans]OOV05772.1 hypothetical protein RF819_02770 [Rhodoferax fermentans]
MAGTEDTIDRGDTFTPTVDADDDTLAHDTLGTAITLEDQLVADKKVAVTGADVTDEAKGDEAVRDDKGRFIPKARFDEAVTKERDKREAAERTVAELQKQLQTVSRTATATDLEAQLVALRKQDSQARLDGDEEKSLDLQSQIDRINRQIVIQESTSISERSREEASESIRVEMAIESLEKTYPVLKEGSDTFDQGLVDLVLAAQNQLITRDRLSPSQALVKATTDIMARFQPAVKADDKPAGGLAGAKGADRTQAAKAKAVDAALRTPPDTRDVGLDSDKLGMKDGKHVLETVDDLKAIPAATLKRMRGDLV